MSQGGVKESDVEVPSSIMVAFVENVREQLATYQEGRGVPKCEYGFLALLASIVTMLSHSVHSVLSLLMALAPITEVALHVARFTLDKTLDIIKTRNKNESIKKILYLVAELALVLVFVMFVFKSILLPVFKMGFAVLSTTTGAFSWRLLI